MAQSYLDEGIILHRRPVGEVDRTVVTLTRNHGKKALIARGVRKPSARNAAGLDLFSHSDLELMPGRGLTVLIRAKSTAEPWPGADLLRTACFAVYAEAVEAISQEDQQDAELFELVAQTRRQFLSPSTDPHAQMLAALLDLSAQAGYLPDLKHCAVCEHPVGESCQWFIPSEGAVAHHACLNRELYALHSGTDAILALRQSLGLADPSPPPTSAAIARAIRLMTSHLAYQLDHRFRSLALLKELEAPIPPNAAKTTSGVNLS